MSDRRAAAAMRVAFLINQYPMISTTFIRREILALERLGLEVRRYAMRGWDNRVVDDEDAREQQLTRYVLREGPAPLLWALLRTLLASPARFLAAAALACRMGWRAERPLPYHFAYLAEACRLLPWLRGAGVAHVHTHFGTNAAEVAMLARALGGPPYSFTVHGPVEFDNPRFLGIAEKIRRAAFVVAITSFARSQLYRWVEHAQWPKVKVIHSGLEPAFHERAVQPPAAAPALICVGRLSAEKGQLLLVDAAARLAAKGIHFELVLVGDGPMRDDIAALVEKHQLAGRVRITGAISTAQLREEMLRARGLVLASFAEGLPMVIMEAMALRRPVATTSIAGIPELVEPGVTGWLFPPGSVDALAAAMEEFLACPPETLRRMGEAAYRRVLERHSIDTEAAKLAEQFRNSATP